MAHNQEEFAERLKHLRRVDPDALLSSDLDIKIALTPEEELALLRRKSDELTEIFKVCQSAGYYGKTSLAEFIKQGLK
ncbi:hypothetical protein [Pseudomonas baetica]|uniref:hypothetical protein n=1 Tax=Pseudomonas baetica TaxID=674054 RepID=UPI0024052C41|nr:hypothetical protein [Pseudomonas baetica]MDF9778793.1 hypothetical protein [Pseudomonas baetica]